MKAFRIRYINKSTRKTKMRNLDRKIQKNRKTTQDPNNCKFNYQTSSNTLKNNLKTWHNHWNGKNKAKLKQGEKEIENKYLGCLPWALWFIVVGPTYCFLQDSTASINNNWGPFSPLCPPWKKWLENFSFHKELFHLKDFH